MKPFKPPTLVNRNASRGGSNEEPPAKKRRISGHAEERIVAYEAAVATAHILKRSQLSSKIYPPPRKPLDVLKNSNASSRDDPQPKSAAEAYYLVLWRRFTAKKNKTWDGDGVLSVFGQSALLQEASGKELGRGVCKGPLLPGSELSIGGKDVQVDTIISKDEYLAGKASLSQPKPSLPSVSDCRGTLKDQIRSDKATAGQKERLVPSVVTSGAGRSAFKIPLLGKSSHTLQGVAKVSRPRHDPSAEGALVMKRPRGVPKGRHVVDVVVDPILTKALRPHQREGVAFLYECVMGMKTRTGEGAVLADEMGLGKTLQTIALLWTLLKQSPVSEETSVIKRALIVCPVTLVNNWRREIHKWLGRDRIGVFVADSNNVKLTDFTMGRAYQIMIIGYEKLTKVQDQLRKGSGIDIVIADEGHRLKTEHNKAALAIKSLNTGRRIILSGTPLQNDLKEFYNMVELVNPGVLDKYTTFKREFETPIWESRQPQASKPVLEKGETRSQELASITEKFILRRTSEILANYLPPKTEFVMFCRPTSAQLAVYRAITTSPIYSAVFGSSALVLELINILKKVCNSPALLLKKRVSGEDVARPELLEILPAGVLSHSTPSAKVVVLERLLHNIRTTTEEKVVIVSNYTSTMDMLQAVLTANSWSYIRLDGSTSKNKRQDLVDRFNRSPPSNSFVFLISAKAGGVGINLIGASRLILFDLDWNPATDLQAMARVHRDGQKRPCFIYRLLAQGTLDEKIFQRQISKTGLADSIVDGKSAMSGFTREELRDLFTLDESDGCQTHKLMGCDCGGRGMLSADAADAAEEDEGNSSTGFHDERDIEELHLEDDGDDETGDVYVPQMIATKLTDEDIAAMEAEHKRQKRQHRDSTGKLKMLSLMQYTHFDTTRRDEGEDIDASGVDNQTGRAPNEPKLIDLAIDDDVLRSVIHDTGHRVGFVFAKGNGMG